LQATITAALKGVKPANQFNPQRQPENSEVALARDPSVGCADVLIESSGLCSRALLHLLAAESVQMLWGERRR